MQIAPITLRKIIGLLLFSIGIYFLLGGGYFLYEKITSTQTTIAAAHPEDHKLATSNIHQAKPFQYGWLLMMGLVAIAASSYLSRSHKSNVPRITLDFRDKRNHQSITK
jgi:hypothetical protein